MKRYVVYYQDYDYTEIKTACDTLADAEEYVLTIMEETEYEDYLFRCVQYRDYFSLEEYLKCRRGAMEYHNCLLPNEGYKTLEGFDLLMESREYYIKAVEVY